MSDRKLENQILWVVLIVAFSIIFLLLIETFEFREDRISLSISALGAIGAVAAALAAAKSTNLAKHSINRQQKQFEKSIEPFIVPIMNNYTFPGRIMTPEFVMANWDSRDTNSYADDGFEILLLNIANGVAKNISVEYEMKNYQEIVRNYENCASETEKNILDLQLDEAHYDESTENVVINFQPENRGHMMGNYQASNFDNEYITFMYKENIEEDKISIPILFTFLTNLWLYQSYNNNRCEIKPTLNIKITCQDLADNNYEFKYRAYLRSSHYFEDSDSSEMSIGILTEKIV